MKKDLIIIKLGGSVITYKASQKPKLRKSVIKSLAKQIKTIAKDYQIILVHGAGSFGHPLAKKYNLTSGFRNKQSKIGFAETAQSMTNLNSLIVKILNDNQLPSVGLSPRSFITQMDGIMNPFNTSVIKSFLKQNLTPVLFGDGVLDNKLGCSILSGDVIIPYLAKKLDAKIVIFLSDVDGIFDDDPKLNQKAKLIPEINNANWNFVLQGLKTHNQNDVTGEMAGKLLSIKNNLPRNEIVITCGFRKDIISKIFTEKFTGTRLYFN